MSQKSESLVEFEAKVREMAKRAEDAFAHLETPGKDEETCLIGEFDGVEYHATNKKAILKKQDGKMEFFCRSGSLKSALAGKSVSTATVFMLRLWGILFLGEADGCRFLIMGTRNYPGFLCFGLLSSSKPSEELTKARELAHRVIEGISPIEELLEYLIKHEEELHKHDDEGWSY